VARLSIGRTSDVGGLLEGRSKATSDGTQETIHEQVPAIYVVVTRLSVRVIVSDCKKSRMPLLVSRPVRKMERQGRHHLSLAGGGRSRLTRSLQPWRYM